MRIPIVDSHTEGEPTRVVLGGVDLPLGDAAHVREALRSEMDWLRTAVVCEPRGSDAVVAALLLPAGPGSDAGVVFMNNVGYLGMCVHGTIGVVRTLLHLGRVSSGEVRLDTPAGVVTATVDGEKISVRNVRSWRESSGVRAGEHVGDVAYGGNWFFLAHGDSGSIDLTRVPELTEQALKVRRALPEHVDHVEFFGAAGSPENHSRNFVLCPGAAYDRSPCGTGTSAKLACLAADGKLAPGEVWRQESVVGGVFEGSYEHAPEGGIIPTITGRAWVTGEGELVLSERDPFRHGIVP